MNIVLIGYRGTGKTAVAKKLAQTLKKNVISTDQQIELTEKKTIHELVEENGWERFRQLEAETIEKLSKLDNLIIDCGGGAVLREDNIKNLKKKGIIILLEASASTIRKRIKDAIDRPSLTGRTTFLEEIEEVLEQRKPLYYKVADLKIDTDNITTSEAAEKILEELESKRIK